LLFKLILFFEDFAFITDIPHFSVGRICFSG
jgi:hypothetical protein